jgi:hypothetical protein
MKIYISLASAIDRYLITFKSLPNILEYEPRIKAKVKLYITDLKKGDRIVWMCKLLKQWYLRRAFLDERITRAEYNKALSKIKIDVDDKRAACGEIDIIYESLRHYLSLNISKINDYEFKEQSPNTILKAFEEYEKVWKENAGIGAVPESGKRIVSFPDGSSWFNLGVESCSVEGKAMGHCGNAGNPQPGDNVLSFRTPAKGGSWVPHLTFILQKSGYISEMKGRGNEKPNEKYYPVIIKLLENKVVKGIKGGGYLPEHNFSVLDLPEKDRLALLKKKPTLLSLHECFEEYTSTHNELYLDRVIKALKEGNIEMRGEGAKTEIKINAYQGSDAVVDFADNFDLESLKTYGADDTYALFMGMDTQYDSSQATDVLESLKKNHYDTFTKLAALLKTDNVSGMESLIDEGEDSDDYDEETMEDICFDEIKDSVTRAIDDGYSSGSQSECYKAVQSCLDGNGLETSDREKYELWSPIAYVFAALRVDDSMRLDDWLTEDISFYDYCNETMNGYNNSDFTEALNIEDLEVPNYGFSDFDTEAASNHLADLLLEDGILK